jgi:hypothetical protein
MPPLPVINDVFRITFDWLGSGGVQPRNVIHIRAAGATVADVSTALNAAVTAGIASDHMFSPMDNDFVCTNFNILPLDGSSAGSDHARTGPALNGGSSGDQSPASAAVASFRTSQRGPRGRGRCYVGPIVEAAMEGGFLASGQATSMLGGWDAFHDSLVGDSMAHVVASYVHADAHDISSYRIDNVLGTMRRRQDQLR